jgi:hypothetical protein
MASWTTTGLREIFVVYGTFLTFMLSREMSGTTRRSKVNINVYERPSDRRSTVTWPMRYANYSGFLHEPVSLKRGDNRVDGVIQAARTADDGSAELLVVIKTGEIVPVGIDAVILTNAGKLIEKAHGTTKPTVTIPPGKPDQPDANPANPMDLTGEPEVKTRTRRTPFRFRGQPRLEHNGTVPADGDPEDHAVGHPRVKPPNRSVSTARKQHVQSRRHPVEAGHATPMNQ